MEGGKVGGGGRCLPARSPSELVINAPRLMPLCADDHQAAGRHHVALVLSCEPLILILHGLKAKNHHQLSACSVSAIQLLMWSQRWLISHAGLEAQVSAMLASSCTAEQACLKTIKGVAESLSH